MWKRRIPLWLRPGFTVIERLPDALYYSTLALVDPSTPAVGSPSVSVTSESLVDPLGPPLSLFETGESLDSVPESASGSGSVGSIGFSGIGVAVTVGVGRVNCCGPAPPPDVSGCDPGVAVSFGGATPGCWSLPPNDNVPNPTPSSATAIATAKSTARGDDSEWSVLIQTGDSRFPYQRYCPPPPVPAPVDPVTPLSPASFVTVTVNCAVVLITAGWESAIA